MKAEADSPKQETSKQRFKNDFKCVYHDVVQYDHPSAALARIFADKMRPAVSNLHHTIKNPQMYCMIARLAKECARSARNEMVQLIGFVSTLTCTRENSRKKFEMKVTNSSPCWNNHRRERCRPAYAPTTVDR